MEKKKQMKLYITKNYLAKGLTSFIYSFISSSYSFSSERNRKPPITAYATVKDATPMWLKRNVMKDRQQRFSCTRLPTRLSFVTQLWPSLKLADLEVENMSIPRQVCSSKSLFADWFNMNTNIKLIEIVYTPI